MGPETSLAAAAFGGAPYGMGHAEAHPEKGRTVGPRRIVFLVVGFFWIPGVRVFFEPRLGQGCWERDPLV